MLNQTIPQNQHRILTPCWSQISSALQRYARADFLSRAFLHPITYAQLKWGHLFNDDHPDFTVSEWSRAFGGKGWQNKAEGAICVGCFHAADFERYSNCQRCSWWPDGPRPRDRDLLIEGGSYCDQFPQKEINNTRADALKRMCANAMLKLHPSKEVSLTLARSNYVRMHSLIPYHPAPPRPVPSRPVPSHLASSCPNLLVPSQPPQNEFGPPFTPLRFHFSYRRCWMTLTCQRSMTLGYT